MIEAMNGSEVIESGNQGRHALVRRPLGRRILDGLVHVTEIIAEDYRVIREAGLERAALIADETPYPVGSPQYENREAARTAQLEIDMARYTASRSMPF